MRTASRVTAIAINDHHAENVVYTRSSTPVGNALVFAFVVSSLAFSGIPSLSRVNDVLAIVLAAYAAFRLGQRGASFPACILPTALFLLASLIVAIPNTLSGFPMFLSILPMWIGASSLAVVVQDRKSVNTVLAAMVVAAIANSLAALIGFDSFATYNPLAERVSEFDLKNRSSGLVGNANLFAIQSCLTLLALMLIRPKASKVIVLALWLLALHSVFESGSRKGLGLLFILSIYIFLENYFERRLSLGRLLVFLGSTLVAVVAISRLDSIMAFLRFNGFFVLDRVLNALAGQDTSFLERQFLIAEARQIFLERPFTGHGLDSFRHLSRVGTYSHNNFFEIAVSGGAFLLFAYYAIIFLALAKLRARHLGKPHIVRVWLFAISIIFLEMSSVTYDLEVLPIFLMLVSTRLNT